MQFEPLLKDIGFSDKEVAVYLALLELGSSAVQPIARKAKVARPTTYLVLEKLLKQGLATRYVEGKKTLFTAESPRHLIQLIERQEQRIKDKRFEVEEALPALQAIMKARAGKPTVRYFDGLEGLRSMRREMLMYCRPGQDIWYNLTPVDHLMAVIGKEELSYGRQRAAKGVRAKTVFTTSSPKLKEEILKTAPQELSERRFIPPNKFRGTSGMTIYRDRIAIGTFAGNIGGVIIESESMADMMRHSFLLMWESLD